MQNYGKFPTRRKEDINRGEGGLLAGVGLRFPARLRRAKSGKSCKFIFCPGTGSAQIWKIFLNLVDFYKVSLASRDGVLCHTDFTDITDFLHRCARRADAGFLIRLLASLFAAINLIQRSSSPLRGSRNLVNLVDFFPFGDLSGCGFD